MSVGLLSAGVGGCVCSCIGGKQALPCRMLPEPAPDAAPTMQKTWHTVAKPPPDISLLTAAAADPAKAAAAPGGGATMKMNPNTGALMLAPGAAQPGGAGSPGSLLGTPSLLHTSPPPEGPPLDVRTSEPAAPDPSPLQPLRPPSPKYDERAGGFFTPAPLGPQPPRRARASRDGADRAAHAEVRISDDGTHKELRIILPGPSDPSSGGRNGGDTGAGAAASADADLSDDDIPSPKYDETTCFFTRPRSTDRRRTLPAPPPAATTSPAHPPATAAPAVPAAPGTPQRPASEPQPVGSPAMQGLQAGAATPANIPALALLTPGAAFTHVRPHGSISQLSVPRPDTEAQRTPLSQAGFRTSVPGQGHQLTILSVEVLAATRGLLTPDPRHDELLAVAVAVWYDHEDVRKHEYDTRIFLNAQHAQQPSGKAGAAAGLVAGLSGSQVDVCAGEQELLEAVIAAVVDLDADVLVGFDVMRWSVGYLDTRSRALDMQPPLIRRIGRCPGFPGALRSLRPASASPLECLCECADAWLERTRGSTIPSPWLLGSARFFMPVCTPACMRWLQSAQGAAAAAHLASTVHAWHRRGRASWTA